MYEESSEIDFPNTVILVIWIRFPDLANKTVGQILNLNFR